jgi:hypothetical protein
MARNFGCFLALEKPGTVTIAPVAAAPVPIAVEIVDNKEVETGLVLLLFSCCAWASDTWIWSNRGKTVL